MHALTADGDAADYDEHAITDAHLSVILCEYEGALAKRPFGQFYTESTAEQLARVRFFKLFHAVVADICQPYLYSTLDTHTTPVNPQDIAEQLMTNPLLQADVQQFVARCARLLKQTKGCGAIQRANEATTNLRCQPTGGGGSERCRDQVNTKDN
jgi:hypothetical protein